MIWKKKRSVIAYVFSILAWVHVHRDMLIIWPHFLTSLPLLSESLNELEDNDLDALMADLVADLNATEQKLAADIQDLKVPSPPPPHLPPKSSGAASSSSSITSPTSPEGGNTVSNISSPASSSSSPLPAPPPQSAKPTMVSNSSNFSNFRVLVWTNREPSLVNVVFNRNRFFKGSFF